MISPEDAANIGMLAAMEKFRGLRPGSVLSVYCKDRGISMLELATLMRDGAQVFKSLVAARNGTPIPMDPESVPETEPKDEAARAFLRRFFKP